MWQIGGMPELGNAQVFYPLINTDNLMTLVDTWSKSLRNHTVKWGAEVHRNRMDRFQPQGLNHGTARTVPLQSGYDATNGRARDWALGILLTRSHRICWVHRTRPAAPTRR